MSGQNRRNQLVNAPGCLQHHLDLLKTDLFGEDGLSGLEKQHSNSYYFRFLWGVSGIVPVVLASLFLVGEWLFWLLAMCWLLLAAGYSFLVLKKRYFQINNYQIRISKGLLPTSGGKWSSIKYSLLSLGKPYSKKGGSLASLRLSNASGAMSIPYIEETKARQIYNYLLLHAETSEEKMDVMP